jgi:hypothetical protein
MFKRIVRGFHYRRLCVTLTTAGCGQHYDRGFYKACIHSFPSWLADKPKAGSAAADYIDLDPEHRKNKMFKEAKELHEIIKHPLSSQSDVDYALYELSRMSDALYRFTEHFTQ